MNLRDIFPSKITKDQTKDSGMALILILLLLGIFLRRDILIKFGAIALVLDMIFPYIFFPFAMLWIGISNLLGAIVSKFILAFIFFVIVTPVGLLRRLSGIDSLRTKEYKKGNQSVMVSRNKSFSKNDVEKPF
jgi:hypothetical protein